MSARTAIATCRCRETAKAASTSPAVTTALASLSAARTALFTTSRPTRRSPQAIARSTTRSRAAGGITPGYSPARTLSARMPRTSSAVYGGKTISEAWSTERVARSRARERSASGVERVRTTPVLAPGQASCILRRGARTLPSVPSGMSSLASSRQTTSTAPLSTRAWATPAISRVFETPDGGGRWPKRARKIREKTAYCVFSVWQETSTGTTACVVSSTSAKIRRTAVVLPVPGVPRSTVFRGLAP